MYGERVTHKNCSDHLRLGPRTAATLLLVYPPPPPEGSCEFRTIILCFHTSLKISCSSFVKNAIGNLIGIALSLFIALQSLSVTKGIFHRTRTKQFKICVET